MFGKVDGLFRLPLKDKQKWEKNDTGQASILVIENSPIDWERVAFETKNDRLSETNGIIMKSKQMLIPVSLIKDILKKLHEGHTGIPGINNDIEELSKRCETCIKIRIPVNKTNLHLWQPFSQSFKRIHLDICGPMNGKSYLVVYDTYTCFPFIVLLRKGDSDEIIKIHDNIFIDFQFPKLVVGDNRRNLISKKIGSYYKQNGIRHFTSPLYHPQSNGAAGNLVKKFKILYYKSLKDGLSESEAVKLFLKTYRNIPFIRTMKTPSELMFKNVTKLIKKNYNIPIENKNSYKSDTKEIFGKFFSNRKEMPGNTSEKEKEFSRKKINKEFKVIDHVWERTKNKLEREKAIVKQRIGFNIYKLIP